MDRDGTQLMRWEYDFNHICSQTTNSYKQFAVVFAARKVKWFKVPARCICIKELRLKLTPLQCTMQMRKTLACKIVNFLEKNLIFFSLRWQKDFKIASKGKVPMRMRVKAYMSLIKMLLVQGGVDGRHSFTITHIQHEAIWQVKMAARNGQEFMCQ